MKDGLRKARRLASAAGADIRDSAKWAAAFLKKRPWTGELAVFAVFLALYLPLQSGSSFIDPDVFYHLKMAELTAAHGPVRQFIWLPFTTLSQAFADHHFLYHLALIPFIKALGPLGAAKISTAIFAAAAVAAFAWAMRKLGIRYPFAWALAMGVMNPLAFRIGLAKASAPGVMLVIIGLCLAARRRAWPLAAAAFIHVWTHGSWPALLAVGSAAIAITAWPDGGAGLPAKAWAWARAAWKPSVALWLGAASGIVVNPFFPQNLKFYWEQIVQIAVVNYQSVIGVGSEWYPYKLSNLAGDLPLLFLLGSAAIVLFPLAVARERDEDGRRRLRIALALSAAAILFFAMTLRSRRHVEYFVPLATMAIAAWLGELDLSALRRRLSGQRAAVGLAAAGLLAMTVAYGAASLARAKTDLAGSYPFTLYKQAAQYLIAHTADGEVVIHADWDEMPPLFYWDDHNRYMMGLDPTFFYSQDKSRYWDYVNFTLGKSADPAGVMKEFGSRFVLTDAKHDKLNQMLVKSGLFEKVYGDKEAYIFELKR